MKGSKAKKNQGGQALIMAIIFLLVLTFLGYALVTVATIDIHSSRNLRLAEEALMVAEEGALAGMSWATTNAIQISLVNPGTTVRQLTSQDMGARPANSKLRWNTEIVVVGSTECPSGYQISKGADTEKPSCALIRSVATGMVEELGGSAFNFGLTARPLIQQRVSVTGRIIKMGQKTVGGDI